MIRLLSLRAAKFKQLDDVALAFPQRGSVLIQGLNEAGKSTLFESVFFALFGKALVTEEPNRLDDLINYQSSRAMVKLAFATDGASFAISRTINRGKPNTAVLEVDYAGGKREIVTNLTAANRRIEAELGLDADALLNSCFVEQKKLEKLESMTAQQRRDTLLRLLNLDRLAALEARYKPSSADDFQLQQLRDRLKLAEIQRDLPLSTARLGAVDSELRLLAGVTLRWEIARLRESIAAQQQRQAELEREGQRLASTLAEVKHLETVRDLARAAGEGLLAKEEDRAETERLQREQAALQAAAGRLPELEAELGRLDRLAAGLAELATLDEAQAGRRRELARLAEAAQRVQRLRDTLAERRQSLETVAAELAGVRIEVARAEASERRARQAELLLGWLQIREVAAIAEEGERELGLLRHELSALDQRVAEHASDRHVKQWTAFGLAVAALLAVGLAAGLAAGHIAVGLAGVPLAAVLAAVCWLFAARSGKAARELRLAETASANLRMDLNRREGEQALAQRTGQDPRRVAEIEAELAGLGFQAPSSVAEAHNTLAGLEPDLRARNAQPSGSVAEARDALADLEAEPPTSRSDGSGPEASSRPAVQDPEDSRFTTAADARQRLGVLDGQRQALDRELADLGAQLEREGDPQQTHAQLETEVERASLDLAQRRTALGGEAKTEAEARELAAACRAAREFAKEAVRKAAELDISLRARRQRSEERSTEFIATWEQLRALRPAAEQHVDSCRALWRETGEQLAALDEPALRASAAETGRALATGQERVRVAERRTTEADSELRALELDESRLSVREALPAEALQQQERALAQERDGLFGQVAALRDRQTAIEHQLGLQGVTLEAGAAERELAGFEEQSQVRKQAFRIVTLARRNIVAKVLPSTIRNMGLLLPLLTNDRYRDVDIDPETYKIKVWDESARAMKAKDIFSGGTRDQFSLALRLAFALATLPEELGTAPGFIFLDEPLSSFDTIRTNALVNLLTRGPVAANFDQIFVISHNRAFDEALFDYHLQLDAGRLVSSDLPVPPEGLAGTPQLTLDLAPAGA